MRIAVIGAGIVGVTTAYELAADGHEVTVLERHSGVAAEASFATGGAMGIGPIGPWAVSDGPASLLGRRGGLRLRATLDAAPWQWLWGRWRAANSTAWRRHQTELLRLAQHSQERLQFLRDRLKLEYERTHGLMLLLRTARDVEQAQAGLALLRELGVGGRELEAAACHALEPGLNREQPLAAAIHWAQDEAGNCRQFAHLLREAAERLDVEFRFGTVVRGLLPGDGHGNVLQLEQMALSTGFASSRAAAVRGGGTEHAQAHRAHRSRAAARYLEPVSRESFDAVVIAAGADAGTLLAGVGLKLPLMPVHGYSLTAPLRSPERGPKSALIDHRERVTISRLGQRVRLAGVAELGGNPQRQRRAGLETLYRLLNDWFPGAAHIARPQVWKGARPTLADGPPLVGPSPRAGVWLNLGHGASGWGLACGSARLLADQIAGRATAFDPKALSPLRYTAGRGSD